MLGEAPCRVVSFSGRGLGGVWVMVTLLVFGMIPRYMDWEGVDRFRCMSL